MNPEFGFPAGEWHEEHFAVVELRMAYTCVKVTAPPESPVPASIDPIAPLIAVPLDPLSKELMPLDVPLPSEPTPFGVPLPAEPVPLDAPLPKALVPLDAAPPDEFVALASAPPEALLPEVEPLPLDPVALLSPAHAIRCAVEAIR